MNWWKLLTSGKKVLDVVAEYIPKALEDGKISMDEVTVLIMRIANIFDYKIELTVPEETKDTIIEVAELLDTSKLEAFVNKDGV